MSFGPNQATVQGFLDRLTTLPGPAWGSVNGHHPGFRVSETVNYGAAYAAGEASRANDRFGQALAAEAAAVALVDGLPNARWVDSATITPQRKRLFGLIKGPDPVGAVTRERRSAAGQGAWALVNRGLASPFFFALIYSPLVRAIPLNVLTDAPKIPSRLDAILAQLPKIGPEQWAAVAAGWNIPNDHRGTLDELLRRLLNDPLNPIARYATEVMAAEALYYLPKLASRADRDQVSINEGASKLAAIVALAETSEPFMPPTEVDGLYRLFEDAVGQRETA